MNAEQMAELIKQAAEDIDWTTLSAEPEVEAAYVRKEDGSYSEHRYDPSERGDGFALCGADCTGDDVYTFPPNSGDTVKVCAPCRYAAGQVVRAPRLRGASTYKEVGMLTRNDGLVLRFEDGSEYQLTVVQSKRAE